MVYKYSVVKVQYPEQSTHPGVIPAGDLNDLTHYPHSFSLKLNTLTSPGIAAIRGSRSLKECDAYSSLD